MGATAVVLIIIIITISSSAGSTSSQGRNITGTTAVTLPRSVPCLEATAGDWVVLANGGLLEFYRSATGMARVRGDGILGAQSTAA